MVEAKIVPFKPALLLEGKNRNLVVTDLHIGFENNFAANNIFIGKNSTINETIDEIESIIDSVKADSLILLGDIKASIKSITKSEWNEVPLFFEKISKKADVVLIPGNHDANINKLIPSNVTLVSSIGLVLENILLTHGHTIPSENFSHVEKIIMGHVHPVYFQEGSVLNGQRVWISLKCEKEKLFNSSSGTIEVVILPSFNKYFYATHKKKYYRSISPIVEKIKNHSIVKVISLDGTILGDNAVLDNVL
jgi:hypothetical protein